jgi:hypothetical protein
MHNHHGRTSYCARRTARRKRRRRTRSQKATTRRCRPRTVGSPLPAPDTANADRRAGDDGLAVDLLIRIRVLISGHLAPPGPSSQLSVEQLIEFWGDDMPRMASGRHARRTTQSGK